MAVTLGLVCRLATAQTTGGIEGHVAELGGGPISGAILEATSTPRCKVSVRPCQGPMADSVSREFPPGAYRIQAKLEGFETGTADASVPLDGTVVVSLDVEVGDKEGGRRLGGGASDRRYIDDDRHELPERTDRAASHGTKLRRHHPSESRRNDRPGRDAGALSCPSIYGATSVENQWIVDGVDTTNVIKGFQGKAINTEFVEEVQVKTGGYQAEYGRALGGVINVVTKSGGNALRGDAFVYHDRSAWQAQQVVPAGLVLTGMRVADYTKTDFGFDLGGPIVQDRLWFFLAASRVDQPGHVARYDDTPLVSASQRFPLDATDSLYSGKLTWKAGTGTTVIFTAFSDPTTNSGAGGADPRQGSFAVREITNPDPGTWESTRHIGGTGRQPPPGAALRGTAFSTLQAARHRDRYELLPAGAGDAVRFEDWTCMGGTPDEPCERPPGPNFVTGGLGAVQGATNRNGSTRDQIRGDVTLFLGPHELKLGGDVQRETTTSVTAFSGGQLVQQFNETGRAYYAHSFFAKSRTDLTPADSVSEPRTINAGAFLQDSWRPLPGLTVNAGLRWDRQDISDYRRQTVILTEVWQPRVGVVWDPRGDGKTKVYAFAGRFSYGLPTDLSVGAFGDFKFTRTFNFDPVGLTHDPSVPDHARPILPSGGFAEPVDAGIAGGYQDELTVGLERSWPLDSPSVSRRRTGAWGGP